MALKIYDTLKPQGDYPAVKAEDVLMPDGKRLSEAELPVGSGEAPVFDLSALGMAAVPLDGSEVVLQTDTTEIMEAVSKGAVVFNLNFLDGEAEYPVSVMGNAVSVDDFIVIITCAVPVSGFDFVQIYIIPDNSMIMARYVPQSTISGAGLPEVTAEDNGKILAVVDGAWVQTDPEIPEEVPTATTNDNDKILQVVDGVYTLVAVKDSAVAAYVEDYINSALEGDY